MGLGSTQSLTEVSTWNISWGVKVAGRNLVVSASWKPQGLPRPVQGLLYCLLHSKHVSVKIKSKAFFFLKNYRASHFRRQQSIYQYEIKKIINRHGF